MKLTSKITDREKELLKMLFELESNAENLNSFLSRGPDNLDNRVYEAVRKVPHPLIVSIYAVLEKFVHEKTEGAIEELRLEFEKGQ